MSNNTYFHAIKTFAFFLNLILKSDLQLIYLFIKTLFLKKFF